MTWVLNKQYLFKIFIKSRLCQNVDKHGGQESTLSHCKLTTYVLKRPQGKRGKVTQASLSPVYPSVPQWRPSGTIAPLSGDEHIVV